MTRRTQREQNAHNEYLTVASANDEAFERVTSLFNKIAGDKLIRLEDDANAIENTIKKMTDEELDALIEGCRQIEIETA